ncbi:LLM class flavin-dependent oxidoreductase [Sinomicrobium soli]|uniref:LLM class flavin-dependent oxidoreductase n=1 Tax=Sinomicrobium sp. N-1-3-6 TaxID=2219864 RepID=UPI000DCD69F1|nr:LLM class flavin-dependent oxidoreductase [Sinomicrobium sp. N-1-3-6]RAV31022.1 LLM class flavin-dependent oxidoreductase [Sinomicrobium sp. N-1-3-6]
MDAVKTAWSVLELATIAKGNTIHQTYENAVALAKQAEASGYTRMWFAEHHNMPAIASSAPQILIGHIAQATATLRVGSGGIMLPNHSPLIVAEQFATLGHLFPGRIDLGLGRAPGTDPETSHAIKPGFVQASHSFPADIKTIQTYFSVENKAAKVRVTQAEGVDVPIFILGSSTSSAHLAAEKGLPYAFASHFSTAQLHDALHFYRSEFQPSPALQKPYVMAGVNVFIADTDSEAEKLYTSHLRLVINILTGTPTEYIEPPTEMTADFRNIMQHPRVEQMIKYTFIGSRETVKKQVLQFLEETQADELIIATNMYDIDARLKSTRLFGEIMTEINTEEGGGR